MCVLHAEMLHWEVGEGGGYILRCVFIRLNVSYTLIMWLGLQAIHLHICGCGNVSLQIYFSVEVCVCVCV